MITSLSGVSTMNDDFTASLEQAAEALQDIANQLSVSFEQVEQAFNKLANMVYKNTVADLEIFNIQNSQSLNRWQKWWRIRQIKKRCREIEREQT